MDVGKAFTFFQEDPKWATKLLIGGGIVLAATLLSVTVIGGIAAFAIMYGYVTRLTRNVAEGHPRPLPEWEDWGGLLRDGLKLIAVYFLAILPFVLLGLLLTIPAIPLLASDNSGANTAGAVLYIGAYCLLIPLSLLLSFAMPVPIARLAVTGSIREALRVGEVFATLRANIVPYLIVFALTTFITSLIAYLGLVACLVGIFFTSFYALLVNHHLYGQAYRQAQGLGPAYGQQPTYGRVVG